MKHRKSLPVLMVTLYSLQKWDKTVRRLFNLVTVSVFVQKGESNPRNDSHFPAPIWAVELRNKTPRSNFTTHHNWYITRILESQPYDTKNTTSKAFMPTSCSPIWIPRALEPKDSPQSRQTPRFIPANHMPKRQANSLPFRDPILHIPPINTHAVSRPPNPGLTLRDVCDPLRRNIADELEHSPGLPAIYEDDGAIWTMGRDTAVLPGTPYLTSGHSKLKPWQGSPSTTNHALELPPLSPQTAAEYRRRNLVKKFKTPFSHDHGTWDDLPMDLEAVAQAQQRGLLPSKRERVGQLILRLLGRKEARDCRGEYLGGTPSRGASMDSCFNNDDIETPVPRPTIARTKSLELRQQAIKLVGTIRRRRASLQPGQLNAGQYEKSPLESLETTPCTYYASLVSDNSEPKPRGGFLQFAEQGSNRIAQKEEPPDHLPYPILPYGDWNRVMPGACRSLSLVEVTAEDRDSLVSESDVDDSLPVFQTQSPQQLQRFHRQSTTLDIVVESEHGQILLQESYHIPRNHTEFTGSDGRDPPPINVTKLATRAVDVSQLHDDNDLGVVETVKAKQAHVSTIPISQTNTKVRTRPPTPTTSFIDMAENRTLTRAHLAPNVSSVTPETLQSHPIAHERPPSMRECSPDSTEALDCHATGPEVCWFRMGAHLQIPDRAAANDEYHRIKLQRIEQLKNRSNRHRNPTYARFKAEYRRRKQEEHDEERKIRSLAKQNVEAAMFFQVLETESDLERRRPSSSSKHRPS